MNPETGNSKFETRNSKLKAGKAEFENRDSKIEIRNSKFENQNSKLEIQNSKLRNLKPKIENPKSKMMGLLVACAALPYANTLFNALAYDDNTQIINNPYIQSFRHVREIFTTTVWSYIGTQGVTNYYRPMMTVGYLLCYQFFGPLAYGFHLGNVLLHIAVVCVLFLVTERVFPQRALQSCGGAPTGTIVAFVSAGVFALHPIHSESVAWIAAVTDLELTLFYLLAFWFFLEVPRPGGGRSVGAQLATVASFALATLSKEQALTFPLLATVYEHFYRDDRAMTTCTQKLSRYGVLWLLSVAYLLLRVHFLGALAPVTQMPGLNRYQSVLSAFALMGQYLWKLLWPAQLCAFYVFRKSASLFDPRVVAGLGAVVLIAALFAVLWRRKRPASFALVWLLATLAPVLNARWMAANVFAERYLYLPSVGFCWMLAWAWVGLLDVSTRYSAFWRRALVAVLCVVAALCAFRIVTRNRDWRNDVVLYTRTLADSPNAYHILNNLGTVYWNRGDAEGAEREWRKALKLAPTNAIILNNLGLFYTKQKRYADAVTTFRQAMLLKPNYTDPHLNLGVAYEDIGLREVAELQLRAAVALSPLNTRARNELGKLYFGAGRLPEAEEQFRRSIESEPNVVGYDGLGDICLRRGTRNQAQGAFERAVSLNRFDSHARFGLGMLYATTGQKTKAVREYQAGLQTDPNNPEALAALQKLKAQIPDAILSRP